MLSDLDADGVALGVSVADAVEFGCRGSFGDEDVNPRTVFYAASVTKQIVGTLLARAVTNQMADVDESVVRWLPELPTWMTPVRLHHLLHHTSALPDLAMPELGVPRSNREVIQRFQRLPPPPRLRPGVSFAYNNAGYVLLAEALTNINHRPVREIAASELFGPLGLADTRLGGPTVSQPGVPDPPGTIGDGGLWTSVTDLTCWLRACNATLVDARTHRLAETTTRLIDGTHLSYAWGLRITPTANGRLISHGGSWGNWVAKTVRVPERQVTVAILSVGAGEQQVSDTGTHLAEALVSS